MLSIALLVIAPAVASATPLTWNFSGATFSDGGPLTGFFVFDADTQLTSAFQISVSGGDTATFPAFTYDSNVPPAFMAVLAFDRFRVFQGPDQTTRQVRWDASQPLTNAGGTIALDLSSIDNALECFSCAPLRLIEGGSITAVPEASAAALFSLGVLGLAVRRRHNRA